MGQPPILRRHDGGSDDASARAARWFRLIAATMTHGAEDLQDTPYHAALQRQSAWLEATARELAPAPAERPVLRLV